jgi:glycosyltransferase involved in cell wall biosynthesis
MTSLYITNWSLAEPLCQSQTVAYLKLLAGRGHNSCLITFERLPYAMSSADAARTARELADIGIRWLPIPYHRRKHLLVAAGDLLRGTMVAVSAILRHRPRIVHTRTSVPAAIGLIASGLTATRFLYDADSELSEEYVDGSHWARNSTKYRVLSRIERLCRRRADAIVVLTDRLRAHFEQIGVTAPITVIPCCVDVERLQFNPVARESRRAQIDAGSEKLLVYVGKTGPRYMVDETIALAKAIHGRVGGARLLILSHDDAAVFQRIADRHQFRDRVVIYRSTVEEIPDWLSAADAGIALIRPTSSERGSSPIKISEYLAAGLPVLTTPGIGDMSEAIARANLGVVVSQTGAGVAEEAADRLVQLWSDSHDFRLRCAAWARRELALESVGVARYSRVYEALAGSNQAAADARVSAHE